MTGSPTINLPGNINLSGGEVQNGKLQSLTSKSSATEADFWYDSVNHIPKYHNGTDECEFGRIYTGGTGITVSNGNAISVNDYNKLMKNTATGAYAITLKGTSATDNYAINIGEGSQTLTSGTALGYNAKAGYYGTALGYNATSYSSSYGIALGRGATAQTNDYAYQIGYGTNSTAKTLAIGFGNDTNNQPLEYTLLDGTTGLIPDARLSSNIARTSALSDYIPTSQKGANSGVAELDSNGKVPSSQLPSFVDDVIDTYIVSGSTALTSGWLSTTDGGSALTPETGKIYVVLTSGEYQNKTYRWSGTTYVEISASPGQATESSAGIAEIATTSEVSTGTDDTKIVTPLKLANAIKDFITGISASDVVTALGYTPCKKVVVNNPALTSSNNVCTWTFNKPSGVVNMSVTVYEIGSTSNTIVYPTVSVGASTITISFLSATNISSDTYQAVCIG